MQHTSLSMPQRLTLIALVAAFGIRVLQVIVAHYWLPLSDTIELLHDDAFYYLAIAQNMASGAGSTFGGINQTNGYQWLWQMLLSLTTWALSLSKPQLFQLATFSGYLCMALLGLLIWVNRRSRHHVFFTAIFSGLLVAAFAFREVFWHGMETTLFLLLLPFFMAWVEGKTRSIIILFIAALLPLVRLDALALIAAAYLVMAAKGEVFHWRDNLVNRFGPGLAAALTLLVYCLLNQKYFGVALPISGLVKGADAPHFANFGIIWYYLNSATGIAILLLLLTEFVLRKSPDVPGTFRRSIVVMAIATVIQYAYYACLSGWPLWPWYLYLQAGFVAMIYARIFILLPALFSRHGNARRGMVMPAIVALAVAIIFLAGAVRTNVVRPLIAKSAHEACQHTGVCLPPPSLMSSYPAANLALLETGLLTGHRIAMGDRAGSIGYWMPANTVMIQTEGLVEDKAFLEARLSGHAEEYLARENIELFVVDRENYLNLGSGAESLTVIPEPTQGRVSNHGAFPLCFSDDALIHKAASGPYSQQRVYDFKRRKPCSLEAWQLMWKYEKGQYGLRRLAVTSEYGDGYTWFSVLEKWDRSRPHVSKRQTMPQGNL